MYEVKFWRETCAHACPFACQSWCTWTWRFAIKKFCCGKVEHERNAAFTAQSFRTACPVHVDVLRLSCSRPQMYCLLPYLRTTQPTTTAQAPYEAFPSALTPNRQHVGRQTPPIVWISTPSEAAQQCSLVIIQKQKLQDHFDIYIYTYIYIVEVNDTLSNVRQMGSECW